MKSVAAILLPMLACASPASKDSEDTAATKLPPPADAGPVPLRIPSDPAQFAPSHVRIAGTGAEIGDVGRCKGCHEDVFEQWSASAHANASFSNPIYRLAVDRFRERRGFEASRFCGGCHDLALLVDGAMDVEIDPADPRAHAGITCFVCHGATQATVDGNASLTIDVGRIVVPSAKQRITVEQHRASVKPIAGPNLCGACHRAFLSDEVGHPSFLPGLDDYGSWQGSAFASAGIERVDEVEAQSCRDCHMRKERARHGDRAASEGRVSSHRFLGAHTQLAAMRGDDEQLAAERAQLKGKVAIDVAAILGQRSGWHRPAEVGDLVPGESIRIDVVLRNLDVGHFFPGGTTDAQDTWIELEVGPEGGPPLASSGHEGGHVLRTLLLGDDGVPRLQRQADEFRAKLGDQLVPPRGARVVSYQWTLPAKLPQPLLVSARLMHRSRNQELSEAVCADSRTARGRAFERGAQAAGRRRLDGCAPAPVTTVAKDTQRLPGGTPVADRFRRLYDHGEALLTQVQERVDEARDSLSGAWEAADSNQQRAKVAVAMVKLEGRLGRFAEAARWARDASKLGATVPANAALARAAAQVWRWAIAVRAWSVVTRARPDSVVAWRGLATAYGSLGEDRRALEAATAGLRLSPRDPDLLLVQAVASRAQSHPQREAADRAFARFRLPDDATRLRIRCAAEVPGCANERLPVPLRRLVPP